MKSCKQAREFPSYLEGFGGIRKVSETSKGSVESVDPKKGCHPSLLGDAWLGRGHAHH